MYNVLYVIFNFIAFKRSLISQVKLWLYVSKYILFFVQMLCPFILKRVGFRLMRTNVYCPVEHSENVLKHTNKKLNWRILKGSWMVLERRYICKCCQKHLYTYSNFKNVPVPNHLNFIINHLL